ncbi:hypothetical protein ABBQ38_009126 [Trebouxia sp. C0009 RCD-2024]
MQSDSSTRTGEERNPLPRTGDYAAFIGRSSHQYMSPRSGSQEDMWAPGSSSYEPLDVAPAPSNADVELRGITSDGGMALHVEITDDDVQEQGAGQHLGNDILQPAERQTQSEQRSLGGQAEATQPYKTAAQASAGTQHSTKPPRPPVPKLAVVLMCAGTRGDVQPFIALGLKLQEYGHRVRVASHGVYRKFVTSFGLEFYPLGGDPKVLSDYIVKNRGIMPGSARDAYDQYREVELIVMSTYKACVETDTEGNGQPFTAQAIISNPPTYGHIHCAEKLGVPLHMFFTMPWSPTKAFPHPLARLNAIKDTRMAGYRNYLSYMAVDEFTYTGLVHVINKFRVKTLGLVPVRLGNKGPHLLAAHQVPFAYCWSEALVPKPADWGDHIDVVGYCFLNEGSHMKYEPPRELREFLAAGKPPVYIGFGSLMVDDAKKLTRIILEAAKETDQRVLLSRGWGNLGEGFDVPDTVMLLDNVPHDWLLPHCCAVVHHGGAGTTAAGLIAGCPTTVVPFFGDQPFWGAACARMGVGPKPIPIDKLETPLLVEALNFMLKPEVQAAAQETGQGIKHEDGLQKAVESFHRHLPVEDGQGGLPLTWELTKPHFGNFFTETSRGMTGLVSEPVRGFREGGVLGGIKGVGKGIGGTVYYPLKGVALAAEDIGVSAVNAGVLLKTKGGEQYAGAKKGIGSLFGGGNNSREEPEVPLEPHESRANLAAQHELDALADTRETEAEEDYEDVAARTEADRQRQPMKRRFGVKFNRVSSRLPAITSYFSRNSRNARRDNLDAAKDSTEMSVEQADMQTQSAAQPVSALGQPETSKPESVASQDFKSCMEPVPGNMHFSSTPVLSGKAQAPLAQSAAEQSTPGLSAAAETFNT